MIYLHINILPLNLWLSVVLYKLRFIDCLSQKNNSRIIIGKPKQMEELSF